MDTIYGGLGDDLLMGGPENDLFSDTHGTNQILGEEGVDTVSYGFATQAVVVDLTAGTARGPSTDSLIGIENVVGTPFADRITGNSENNRILGGDDNDAIDGRAGDDELYGEAGDDQLTDWLGASRLDGGTGGNFYITKPPTGLSLAGSQVGESNGAVIRFEDGSSAWTPDEIDAAKKAFKFYQDSTGGKSDLLKDSSSSSPLYLVKVSLTDSVMPAKADGYNVTKARTTKIYDRDIFGNEYLKSVETTISRYIYFESQTDLYRFGRTVVHELAHNWDQPEEICSNINGAFRSISGWRHDPPPASEAYKYYKTNNVVTNEQSWYHLKSASDKFPVQDGTQYGKSDLFEDWATLVAEYYVLGPFGAAGGLAGQSPYQEKLDVVRAWFDSVRTGQPFVSPL